MLKYGENKENHEYEVKSTVELYKTIVKTTVEIKTCS